MALQLTTNRSLVPKRLAGAFLAIFALAFQPFVPLNIPAAFAATALTISPTSHTVEGGGTAASEASSSVTGVGFENMKVTFDYNAKKLDTGETLVFGITGDAATEQTIAGLPGDDDSEESSAEIIVPATFNNSNFTVYFTNDADEIGQLDAVFIDNIAITGDEIAAPAGEVIGTAFVSKSDDGYTGIFAEFTVANFTDATDAFVTIERSDDSVVTKQVKNMGIINGNNGTITAPFAIIEGTYTDAGSSSWHPMQPNLWTADTVPTFAYMTVVTPGGNVESNKVSLNTANRPSYESLLPVIVTPTNRYVSTTGANDSNDCTDDSSPCLTIQYAIDQANDGDTIVVAAGEYTEVVTVDKSVDIVGAGEGSTFIKYSSSSPTKDIVIITGSSTNVEMSNLTVGGPGQGINSGVFVKDSATANLHDMAVVDIADNPFSGRQGGNAIVVGRNSAGISGNATINNVTVSGYQKTGILVDGAGSSATITNSTVTGHGPTTVTGQNGIQISRGAYATISDNQISGNLYTPATALSTSVLLYEASTSQTTRVLNNTLSGDLSSVAVQGSTNVEIANNHMSDSTWFVVDYTVGLDSSRVHSNTVVLDEGDNIPTGVFAAGDNGTVLLDADFTLSNQVAIDRAITLKSIDGSKAKLAVEGAGHPGVVVTSAGVTLENLYIKSQNGFNNNEIDIRADGTVIDGITLERTAAFGAASLEAEGLPNWQGINSLTVMNSEFINANIGVLAKPGSSIVINGNQITPNSSHSEAIWISGPSYNPVSEAGNINVSGNTGPNGRGLIAVEPNADGNYVYLVNIVGDIRLNGEIVEPAHIRHANGQAVQNYHLVGGTLSLSVDLDEDIDRARFRVRKVSDSGHTSAGVFGTGWIQMQKVNGEWQAEFDTKNAKSANRTEAEELNGTYTIMLEVSKGSSSAIRYVDLNVDNTAPTVAITSPADGSIHSGNVELKATATDENLHHYWLQVKKNGTPMSISGVTGTQTATESFVDEVLTTLTEEGSYEVTLAARDAVGGGSNTGNRSGNVVIRFVIDKSAPVIDITNIAVSTDKKLSFNLEANDVGPAGLEIVSANIYNEANSGNPIIRLGKNSSGGTTGSTRLNDPYSGLPEGTSVFNTSLNDIDVSGLATGTYTIRAFARDHAGNELRFKTVQFTVDNTAPEVEILGATLVSENAVEFTGTVFDENLSHYYCWLTRTTGGEVGIRGSNCVTTWANGLQRNGNPATTLATGTDGEELLGQFDVTGLEDGEYVIHVGAKDRAGNLNTQAAYTITIDRSEFEVTEPEEKPEIPESPQTGGDTAGGPESLAGFTTGGSQNLGLNLFGANLFPQPQLQFTNPIQDEGTEEDDSEDSGTEGPAILGEQSRSGTPLEDTGEVLGVMDSKLLGLAWYWWLAIVAALIAGWLAFASMMRRRREEEV